MARRTTRENRAIEALSLLKSNGKSKVVFKPADPAQQDLQNGTYHQDADMTDRHSSSEDEEEDDLEDIDDEIEDMEEIEDDLEDDMLDDDAVDEESVLQTMPPTPIDDPAEKEPVVVMDQEALTTRTNQEDKHENPVVNGQEHIPTAPVTTAPQQTEQPHDYTQHADQQISPANFYGTESTNGAPLQPSSGNNAPVDTPDESREPPRKKRGRPRDSKFKDGETNGIQQQQTEQFTPQSMRSSPPIGALGGLGSQEVQHQQTSPDLAPQQQLQPPAYQAQGTTTPTQVQGSQHVSPIPHPGSIPRPVAQHQHQHRQPTPVRDQGWPRNFTGQIPMPQPYSRPAGQGVAPHQQGGQQVQGQHQGVQQQVQQGQQLQNGIQPGQPTKYYLGHGRWHEGPPPTEGMAASVQQPHQSQFQQPHPQHAQPDQYLQPATQQPPYHQQHQHQPTTQQQPVSAIPTPGVIPASNQKAKEPMQ